MKALRTCGVEQLEPRAMLAAFGPSGGVHEVHVDVQLQQFDHVGPASAHFSAGDGDGRSLVHSVSFRPPTPSQQQFVIQIIILQPPVVVIRASAPAVHSPRLPAVLAAGYSFANRGEGEASSPLRSTVQRPPANLLAISLTGDAASSAAAPLSSGVLNSTDQAEEPERENATTRAAAGPPAISIARKLLALNERPAADGVDASDDLLDLDSATTLRGKRKLATHEAPSEAGQMPVLHLEDSMLQELPRELYAQLLAAEQASAVPIADDGLIELLAADVGTAQVAASQRASAEPIQPAAAAGPVLEIATADDAQADTDLPAQSDESPPPPVATLH